MKELKEKKEGQHRSGKETCTVARRLGSSWVVVGQAKRSSKKRIESVLGRLAHTKKRGKLELMI